MTFRLYRVAKQNRHLGVTISLDRRRRRAYNYRNVFKASLCDPILLDGMNTNTTGIDEFRSNFAPQPFINVLGVEYMHLQMEDGTDLYVTEFGLPFIKCLLPKNHWADVQWRENNRTRLLGSSRVFRMSTKVVDGKSKDIVIKWNRMGQDIPGVTAAKGALDGAEFNSPFMEFSLLLEMRNSHRDPSSTLYTQKPLAIYVPQKFVDSKGLGRRQWRMDAIKHTHREIDLDQDREYGVIYEWLKGIDAAQAYGQGLTDRAGMIELYERANTEMEAHGFCIRDNKPRHLIVRPTEEGELAKDPSGKTLYGLIDFELLERTPEREATVRASKRHDYLIRQAKRFEPHEELPPGLTHVNIMGVDYIYGHVESTGGSLWVVGRDASLFEYFLPEKWRRTPRTKLASSEQLYRTTTKDNIHLVWRVSRVGERPDCDPFIRSQLRVLAHGFNSPFEEFSIAMELSNKGVETKYPRAIYMTGTESSAEPSLFDPRRYQTHNELKTPDGKPILNQRHAYMTIWGSWNAPDDILAVKDEDLYEGIDAISAYRENHLTQKAYLRVMRSTKKRLAAAGIEDLSLSGSHLLLSLDKSGRIVTDEAGKPVVRIRNFELLRRTNLSTKSTKTKTH